MGFMDKLKEEANELAGKGKELAETKGKELLAQGEQAIGEKADDLKNQAAKKVAGFVDDQTQKLTDKFKK